MEKVLSRNYHCVPNNETEADADADSEATLTGHRHRSSLQHFLKRNLAAITIISLLFILALLVIAIITAITIEPIRQVLALKWSGNSAEGQRQCIPTTPRTTVSCGNSTAEAEALGCTLDPVTACWLHRDCPHDFGDVFATFNDGNPFTFYYDEKGTRPVKNYREVGQNKQGFYFTSTRAHLAHCLYLLRRGHDVHMRGDRLDTLLADMEHVDHCTDFLANWLRRPDPELDELGTKVYTNCFMSCS